jgi:hypothetical protein
MLYRAQLAVSGIGTQNFSGDCIGMVENPTAIRPGPGPRRPVYNYLEIVEADVLVLSLSITFFVFVIPI